MIVQADAVTMPLADESVDLIVTSPPYFALRSYRDGDEHYAGQIGSEPTPQAFLEALWAVTAECWRVLKPTGSCWVNLGDKRSGSGGHNNSGISGKTGSTSVMNGRSHQAERDATRATRRNAPDRYNQAAFGRPKSKMLLPHRFAIGCEDGMADPEGMGWVVRQDAVWAKVNGLPESVVDRCRDSHEYWFHFTKQGRYFSAVDEVREPHLHGGEAPTWEEREARGEPMRYGNTPGGASEGSPSRKQGHVLGRLPGSVWTIPSEPLIIPAAVQEFYDLPDHFAAYPQELPRRIILGWSPSGVCVECGEGRRPVVAKRRTLDGEDFRGGSMCPPEMRGRTTNVGIGNWRFGSETAITGYACACTPRTSHRGKRGDWKAGREVMPEHGSDDFHTPGNAVPRRPGGFGTKVAAPDVPMIEYHLDGWTPPPTKPAVVLDPFAGTGTTIGVARALGRTGVGLDLSHDYARLARWRVEKSGHFAKTAQRTHRDNQGDLFGMPA